MQKPVQVPLRLSVLPAHRATGTYLSTIQPDWNCVTMLLLHVPRLPGHGSDMSILQASLPAELRKLERTSSQIMTLQPLPAYPGQPPPHSSGRKDYMA